MSLKTLIVDDEPLARKVLREELESFADVEIVGEADDGPTALARIAGISPISSFWIYRCQSWAAWR